MAVHHFTLLKSDRLHV